MLEKGYLCLMILKANCKINLGLNVLRRREDGYHDLETVMLPVRELFDEVEVLPASEFLFKTEGLPVDCPVEENLCVKAFRLMQRRYALPEVAISLRKRVPFGAGLGGGSSDATMVLLALNHLFSLALSEEELIALASVLGSDTAFFVRNTPQLCRGRGELMEPIELPLAGLWLQLVKPEEGVSTREAYAGVLPEVPKVGLREQLLSPVDAWQEGVKNDFERSVFARHPRLQSIKESLLAQGALYASMSGSGSTLFGLFDRKPDYTPPFKGLFLHQEAW